MTVQREYNRAKVIMEWVHSLLHIVATIQTGAFFWALFKGFGL